MSDTGSSMDGARLTRMIWMLGLGTAAVLMCMGTLALLLHGKLVKLQGLQMASGAYAGDPQDENGDGDDAPPPISEDMLKSSASPVHCYTMTANLKTTAVLEHTAPAGGQVQESLPLTCQQTANTSPAMCVYPVAHWMVLGQGGGQGQALYDAVLEGHVRYALIAGVLVRLFLPDAHRKLPSKEGVAALQAQLMNKAKRIRSTGVRYPQLDGGFADGDGAGDGAGQGITWGTVLRGMEIQALLVCPINAVRPANTTLMGTCKYQVSLPIDSAAASRITTLLGTASSMSTVRLMVLAW
jgi:hypothetical protein